jgi:EipB-like
MARATLFDGLVLGAIAIAAAALSDPALAASDPTPAAAAAPTITLIPHRAIYDLKLAQSHGQRAIEAVRGRILYDFSGSACDGYALQFRQVSELDSGEGKISLSDLRAATWEDASAKSFRFNSENYLNREKVDVVDGRAERGSDRLAVKLSKPKDETFNLDTDMVFPTEHIRRIIEAARAGQTILEFPVYDGSETGEKVYNTLTVIGHEIRPGERTPTDAAANKAALKGLKRWPVTVSYFDKNTKPASGEQTPAYAISFELYENGISRALVLDYGDFSVKGEMTQLEIRGASPCKAGDARPRTAPKRAQAAKRFAGLSDIHTGAAKMRIGRKHHAHHRATRFANR